MLGLIFVAPLRQLTTVSQACLHLWPPSIEWRPGSDPSITSTPFLVALVLHPNSRLPRLLVRWQEFLTFLSGWFLLRLAFCFILVANLIVHETKRTTTSCHAGIESLKQVAGPAESRHAIGLVPSPTITILQGWREFSRPITEHGKAKPMQFWITFDTQSKIALSSTQNVPDR